MKKKMVKFLEKISISSVERKPSFFMFGEKEIPNVILDEIKAKKSK